MGRFGRSETMSSVVESGLSDDASPDRVEHDLGGAVYVELLHDARAVRLNGAGTDEQQRGDVLIRFPLGDELKDLTFAIRQRFVTKRRPPVPRSAA